VGESSASAAIARKMLMQTRASRRMTPIVLDGP
jgi:hypothetical protein